MHIEDYRRLLENIVHQDLYGSILEEERTIEDIYSFLKNSTSFINDVRGLISLRTNEKIYAYEKYIQEFFLKAPTSIKVDVLLLPEEYQDIIKVDSTFLALFNSLSYQDKVNYLEKKKLYTSLDIVFLNTSLQETNAISKKLFKEISKNAKLKEKIPNFSITTIPNNLSLDDYSICRLFTKEVYTKALQKKCPSFSDFLSYYEKDSSLVQLLDYHSLRFKEEDNQEIHAFSLEVPAFLSKLQRKYFSLFSKEELQKMMQKKDLDAETLSSCLEGLYEKEEQKKDFSFKILEKCAKHSLTIYPFTLLEKEKRDEIFSHYSLFNRFTENIMIQAICDYFLEEEIVSILRNDAFINEISPYGIELILNKLSFKSSFNMLQRKEILNKIDNLNIKIEKQDYLFIKGFLDSPFLLYKSNHTMIFDMLQFLSVEECSYYLILPYINERLSNAEIMQLIIQKEIDLSTIFATPSLKQKLNVSDYIHYIDVVLNGTWDASLFENKELMCSLFSIDASLFNTIDFHEVNYLYETIEMKSRLSKQTFQLNFASYKAVLVSYLLLGLDGTLHLVNEGNQELTLDYIQGAQKDIIDEKVLLFKENNSFLFQDLTKNLLKQLRMIEKCKSKIEFIEKIQANTFIHQLIQFLLDQSYDTYSQIISHFYHYVSFYEQENYLASKELYNYIQGALKNYVEKIRKKYNEEFEAIILRNFKPKESVLYKERKRVGKNFLDKMKLKLFVQALREKDKEKFAPYFKEGFDIGKIEKHFSAYLHHDSLEFSELIEHVFIPLANERFDKENCLSKLGIAKPSTFHEYSSYIENLQNITKINAKIKQFKKKYSSQEILSLMNYICYGTEIPFQVARKEKRSCLFLQNMLQSIEGEVYIDKSKLVFLYHPIKEIYPTDSILEYRRYLEIIDSILLRTKSYIRTFMHNDNVKNLMATAYFKEVNSAQYQFPITNKNYELKKRVFSLADMEKIFGGYDLSNYKKADFSLKQFLWRKNNILMVADGYYDGVVSNFGLLLSSWNAIYKKANELHMSHITLIQAENLLSLVHSSSDDFSKYLSKDVIDSISDTGYFEEKDLVKRIRITSSLYQATLPVVSSSIPYLSYKNEDYVVKTIDRYSEEAFLGMPNSLYKVGSIGNDFFCYSLLNKNGCQIGIYLNDVLLSKVLGVRNGNTLYLHIIEGKQEEKTLSLLREFGQFMIERTKEDLEPITFLTIVVKENFANSPSLLIDDTICKEIRHPIPTQYVNYEEFKEFPYLLHPNEEIFTDYASGISILLSSSIPVENENFKFYDAEAKYLRPRNPVLKLSNSIGNNYLNAIHKILALWSQMEPDFSLEDIQINEMETIYLGDDFVLFVTNSKEVLSYVLPYDERAKKEVEKILANI